MCFTGNAECFIRDLNDLKYERLVCACCKCDVFIFGVFGQLVIPFQDLLVYVEENCKLLYMTKFTVSGLKNGTVLHFV